MSMSETPPKERPSSDHRHNEAYRPSAARRKAVTLTYTLMQYFHHLLSNSLQQQIHGNLSIYIYADFAKTELFATASVMSGIVAAVSKLPLSKMIDVWGRAEGLLLMVAFQAIGLLMIAYCYSVETYSVGQILNNIGLFGVNYILTVYIADTSALKNRGTYFAFSTSPYLIAPFLGPHLAQTIQRGPGYRWICGVFALVAPALIAPLAVTMMRLKGRSPAKTVISKEKLEQQSLLAVIAHYYIELDVLGMTLLTAAFIFFLLPFQLAPTYPASWQSPEVLIMLIVGIALFPIFAIHERYFARKRFIAWDQLINRTVLSACFLAALLYASFYCWNYWLGTYLMIVYDLYVSEAGYITNIYTIGACFISIGAGMLIKATGDFKSIALQAIPVQMLGGIIMILVRQPPYGLWGIVFAQILLAVSGGTLVVCEQMAAMAAVSDADVAMVLALEGMFSSVGGAIGQTIAGGIYAWMWKGRLLRHLPLGQKEMAQQLYEEGINAIMARKMGSEVRSAAVAAWMDVMAIMCMVGVGLLPVGLILVSLWKRVDVRKGR